MAQTNDFIYLNPCPKSGAIRIQDSFNIREDMGDLDQLMESIIQNGLEQPIHVRKENNMFILEDGHRRLAAIRKAISLGHTFEPIPARVNKEQQTQSERLIAQFTRNSGKPFTPLEQASVVAQLLKLKWVPEDIQAKLGFSRVYFADLQILLAAPAEAKAMVKAGKMTSSMLIELCRKSPDPKTLVSALNEANRKAEAAGTRIMPKHLGANNPAGPEAKGKKAAPVVLGTPDPKLPPTPPHYQTEMVLPRARALLESVRGTGEKNEIILRRIETIQMIIPYLEQTDDLNQIRRQILDPKFRPEGREEPVHNRTKRPA